MESNFYGFLVFSRLDLFFLRKKLFEIKVFSWKTGKFYFKLEEFVSLHNSIYCSISEFPTFLVFSFLATSTCFSSSHTENCFSCCNYDERFSYQEKFFRVNKLWWIFKSSLRWEIFPEKEFSIIILVKIELKFKLFLCEEFVVLSSLMTASGILICCCEIILLVSGKLFLRWHRQC